MLFRSPNDIGFINNTTEPVYKMLAVANAVPGSNTAETLIETYKDVIALDYAETFLNRVIRQAMTALSQSLKRTGIEQEYVETLKRNAQEAQRQLLSELNREPTIEEIAAKVDMTPERVQEIMRLGQDPLSLESPVGEEDGSSIEIGRAHV